MQELGRLTTEEFAAVDKLPVKVILDSVRSLHNVGSIFRTCDAFAVNELMLCGITAKPPHREIQKTALGATESVNWTYCNSVVDAITRLRSKGVKVIGVEQVVGSSELGSFILEEDSEYAFIFGNEVSGVSQEVLDLCDGYLEIPQVGTKHSLNVSVSVGIVLWDVFRTLSK